jgi:hypothetical protein
MMGSMWFDSATRTIYGEIAVVGTVVKFTGIGTAAVTTSLATPNSFATVSPLDGATCR